MKTWGMVLGVVAMAAACAPHKLEADATFLAPEGDVALVDASLAQFEDHVRFRLSVTADRKAWSRRPTQERWKVVATNGGEYIDDSVLCLDEPITKRVTMAVTDLDEQVIYIGPCVKGDELRSVVLAHEIGHVVGATHCEHGVMVDYRPTTIEPSEETVQELRELYGL